MRARILTVLATAVALAALTPVVRGQGAASGGQSLQIYVVDVEGGNAVLFVAPSGESVLIDTGNPGPRDAGRIVAATKDAGVTQIDHLIITHFHGDHFGGLTALAPQIPIKEIIDHGANVQATPQTDEFFQKTYMPLTANAKHTVVKPGDKIAVAGLDWRIVAAGGAVLKSPLPGSGKPNPYCAETRPQEPDPTENAQSVSSVITFGKFRVVHMGDLTWNKEMDLMCPANRLGTTDLLILSHHGLNISNSPALVHALAPRVAIMNNGSRKGGQPETMKIVYTSPGLEDLWQMHFSVLGGQEYTVPGTFIANTFDTPLTSMPIAPQAAPAPGPGAPPAPQHDGTAAWFKVTAQRDGTFMVANTRNGFSKTYQARGK